jgi:hypothetical protein
MGHSYYFDYYNDVTERNNQTGYSWKVKNLPPPPTSPISSTIQPISDTEVLCEYIDTLYDELYENMNPEIWEGKKTVRNYRYRSAKFWTAGIKSMTGK